MLALFRDAWNSDGTWDAEKIGRLNDEYWDADEHSVSLPSGGRFTKLKSKHLISVAISTLKSKYPGCPRFILWLIIRFGHTYQALKDSAKTTDRLTANASTNDLQKDDMAR